MMAKSLFLIICLVLEAVITPGVPFPLWEPSNPLAQAPAPEADRPDEVVPPPPPAQAPAPETDTPDEVVPPPPALLPLPPVSPVIAPSPLTTTSLSFFMHDILGGSHPSGRVVTGVVANTDANNIPFSNANSQIFPINGGIPLNTINGVINDNNYPFLVGLNGNPTNTGKNNKPFVTAGQLPAGLTLQQLMFGSVTVVDNEITKGRELGSSVLGKAQGFYLASSSDGSSHTLALTALFDGGDHEIVDSVSFFGIHRTATPISHIAIIGGTGNYEKAKGYATIETLPYEDQYTTDGLETVTHFTLVLTA